MFWKFCLKEDIKQVGEHSFRVFDANGDNTIEFVEFMVVYNIIAWSNPETILGKMFDIFDLDGDHKITKEEMKRVLKDMSALMDGNSKSAREESGRKGCEAKII